MRRVFAFATGNIWRWSKSRTKLIDYAKKFDIDGVEITFSSKEELYKFKLNNSQIKWLRRRDYVSIHSPFKLVRKAGSEKEVKKQLDYIYKLYKKVNAKNVVIHAKDLPEPNVLYKYKMRFSTENTIRKSNVSIGKLAMILKRYRNLGLCLDVSHAYFWSKDETGRLVNRFKRKITQVHFSGNYKKKDHTPLRIVSANFIKSIQPIKKLDVPIIIEEDIKIKNIKWVKNEIKYIKSLF